MTLTDSQVRWRCRRGMWELDLILMPFFENHFHSLTDDQRATFVELVSNEDQDLLKWLTGEAEPGDATLAMIVELIRERHKHV